MTTKIKYAFSLTIAALVGLVTFGGVAMAAGAAEPANGSLMDLLSPVLDAFRGGQFVYGGALALVVAVALVKRYGGDRFPWLNGDVGGSVLALAGSFFASVAVAIAPGTGATLGLHTIWTAGGVAVAAAGGYTLIKKLVIDPLIKSSWYLNKAPAWFKAGMSVVLWIFGEGGAAAISTAEKAGDAAVAAHPAQGAADPAASGKVTEVK